MKKHRHKIVPASYLILIKDSQVLLIKRANTGYMDGMYSLPSGHVEPFEPAELAAAREAKEEVGINVDIQDLLLVHTIYRKAQEKDHERVDFFFRTDKWRGTVKNCEPDKCDGVRWFGLGELPKNIAPEVETMFKEIAKGNIYSSLNY
jgi:8-oxo-dGTP pyrophosphatase MutT (NUDIX family)